MERPLSGRDEFCEWQERLKRFEASGLSIDAFCRQEGVGRSTLMDWLQTLKKEPLRQAAVKGETRSAERPAFAPVTVNANMIEILLPGAARVRMSAGIDRAVLLDIIRIVSTLPQESPS
jgi:transposase-like protein